MQKMHFLLFLDISYKEFLHEGMIFYRRFDGAK